MSLVVSFVFPVLSLVLGASEPGTWRLLVRPSKLCCRLVLLFSPFEKLSFYAEHADCTVLML